MTISPNSIDPLSLPFVPIEQRSQLPETPCIYFAINAQGVVQYVGKARNAKKRWEAHHKGIDLALMGGVKIAYLEGEFDSILDLEGEMIDRFNPPLNERRRQPQKQKKDKPPTSLRWQLADLMHDRRLDVATLSERTGIHFSTISKLKKEMPTRFDKKTLWKLCNALKCTPGDLLRYLPDEEPEAIPDRLAS